MTALTTARPGTTPADVPARPRVWLGADTAQLLGAALSAFCLTWLLFRVLNWTGPLGFALVWYAGFLATYWEVVREGHGRLAANDRFAGTLLLTGGAVTLIALVFIVTYVVYKGIGVIWPEPLKGPRLGFFTQDMAHTGPLDPITSGGVIHALVGTLEQTGITVVISVPLAIVTAVYLNEVGGRFAKPVRVVVTAMAGIPSIVAGLFIYSMLVLPTRQFSGFAGSLALSVLMLPTVTLTAEEMLRIVPSGLREASLALGAPQWRMVRGVVLPTARAGLVTASILGTARVIGETAPVLLTAFGQSAFNANPFNGPQGNLPLFVYTQIRNAQPVLVQRAWGGALTLLLLVLVLFVLARYVSGRKKAR